MSHCNFNFKCSNTQQQEEFFNVKTEKNVYESFSSNIENQKDNQPNNHKDWLNSSSLFSNFNRKGNKHMQNQIIFNGKFSSPLLQRTQNLRSSFQGQVEAKYFNEQWNMFQQTSEYFIKMAREEKKQKLCQKKTQVLESNSSKTIYEVMIISLIIGYFVSMIYIISKEIFF